MNDFCDLLGTPYAPVSKIAPVKILENLKIKSSVNKHSIIASVGSHDEYSL